MNRAREPGVGETGLAFNIFLSDWAAAEIERNAAARWHFIFLHKPLDFMSDRWLRFERRIGKHNFTVFCGDWHNHCTAIRNGKKYCMVGTTGGGALGVAGTDGAGAAGAGAAGAGAEAGASGRIMSDGRCIGAAGTCPIGAGAVGAGGSWSFRSSPPTGPTSFTVAPKRLRHSSSRRR